MNLIDIQTFVCGAYGWFQQALIRLCACAADRDFDIICAMKTLATANYDFEKLTTDGCVYVDKTDKRHVALVGINFSAKKRNIDEPLIENLKK